LQIIDIQIFSEIITLIKPRYFNSGFEKKKLLHKCGKSSFDKYHCNAARKFKQNPPKVEQTLFFTIKLKKWKGQKVKKVEKK